MEGKPQIIIGGDWPDQKRKSKQYKDLSTICIIPTRGSIPAQCVERWMGLMTPMNQAFIRMFVSRMEVGHAYDEAITFILNHEQLKDFKFVLTLEEDNIPPPDGLLRLYESMDTYDVVGGLYWTKGEEGQPMVYGAPGELPMFAPRMPEGESVQECNGLGMGFTLFRLDSLKDLEPPYFKTVQEMTPTGGRAYTQDLWTFERLRGLGKRVACDTRVRVGHLDTSTGVVW